MFKFFSFVFALAVLSTSAFGSSKQLLKIADQSQASETDSRGGSGGSCGM